MRTIPVAPPPFGKMAVSFVVLFVLGIWGTGLFVTAEPYETYRSPSVTKEFFVDGKLVASPTRIRTWLAIVDNSAQLARKSCYKIPTEL